ncbi:TlpA disulfide reductase family protein [Winogradskyella sp.]|uniref:TlpA family protein disulfide reductase n=1 Tax=Winogradskyella sp. TaxID=1883156 RepID=UPI0026232BD6|nr:TlpA disulfide reductase family protein [Winogradskyella sp.]
MKCFNKKHFSLIIICILTATYSYSQIKVSEFIQESKIASSEGNKLFFVDFWATWCIPCITAKEHLKVLQNQFPDEFYVVSLSSENPLKVERFLEKKPNDLAVAIDYNKETFKAFSVKTLPDGILFNANGEILWRGGAPDLKKKAVSRFLNQQTTSATLSSFFDLISSAEVSTVEYIPSKPLEIKPIADYFETLDVVDGESYLKLTGSLRSILGYLAKVYKKQIVLEQGLDTSYEVFLKKPFQPNKNLAFQLIMEMGLTIDRKSDVGEGISLAIENPKFWDTNQINWGKNNPKYLIGDAQIKADNVSLKEIAYQLAHILDMPVILSEDSQLNLELHDWDFHYKFFQLMQTDLEDNYGIKVEKKKVTFPVYHIQKKAP